MGGSVGGAAVFRWGLGGPAVCHGRAVALMPGDSFTPQDADGATKAAKEEAFRQLFVRSGHRAVERARAYASLCASRAAQCLLDADALARAAPRGALGVVSWDKLCASGARVLSFCDIIRWVLLSAANEEQLADALLFLHLHAGCVAVTSREPIGGGAFGSPLWLYTDPWCRFEQVAVHLLLLEDGQLQGLVRALRWADPLCDRSCLPSPRCVGPFAAAWRG